MGRKGRKTTYNVGKITLGENVHVSDPCYRLNTWCAGTVHHVLPGTYNCFITVSDEGVWGKRVSDLDVVHENYSGKARKYDFSVAVDSGQCGIYDEDYFIEIKNQGEAHEQEWYGRVCHSTFQKKTMGDTIDKKAVVSSSGYGDGYYKVRTNRNKYGQATAIKIDFLL